MNGLQTAVGFLTRVPAGARTLGRDEADGALARAVPWFPVVGVAVGALVGTMYWLASRVLSPTPAAVIAIAAGVIVTGAFHEDGLADCADALWGAYDRDRRLEILRDSRLGTFGVLALVLVNALRIGTLASITPGIGAIGAAVAAHALGRGAAVAVMGTSDPARADGLGASYVRALRPRHALAGVAVALVAAIGGLGGWFFVAVAITVPVAIALRALSVAKLGGIVGDVLGAIEQCVETGVLAVAAALVHLDVATLGWWPR